MTELDKILNNMIKTRRKYINCEGGIESNNGIHCPYCGHYDTSTWEWGVASEGEHNVCCQECDKDFIVTTEIEYTFTATKLLSTP